MAFKLSLVILVLIAVLEADSRRAQADCASRDIDPPALGPTQAANTELDYLIGRVGFKLIEKYPGNEREYSESIAPLSFRALVRKREIVYLVKVELLGETSRKLIHVKIREPVSARVQLTRANEVEHLFSPLGPCYVPDELGGFNEELAFDDSRDEQLYLLVAVLLPKMRENYPNLFGKTRNIEQLSHRRRIDDKGTIYLIRMQIEHDEPGGLVNFRHVHLTILEPRSTLLNVQSMQTNVEDETPIEWF